MESLICWLVATVAFWCIGWCHFQKGRSIGIKYWIRLFYFLLRMCGRESKVVFGSNFRNGDFYEFIRLEVPWIRKSHFERLALYLSVICIIQLQMTAETSNLLFYIGILWRCHLKLFRKIGQNHCVQGHTKGFWCITAYGQNFVLVHFIIFILHQI